MILVDQYEYIRTAHRVYGKSIRKIQKETGHDRKTIRKALKEEFQEYATKNKQGYPVMGPYQEKIKQWLEADKEQPKKQRHTARRIYNRLVEEESFNGRESTVRRYVRGAKCELGMDNGKAFIPLDPELAKEGEVDWGSAVAILGGIRTPIRYFCMRSKYSGKHFVRAYLCEKQQAFFDGHIHAFSFYGGIFRTLIYDNLTSAVKEVLKGRGRIEQEGFVKFRAYYNFTARFCNVASGHEKGGTEGLVGYARRNYMVPVPEAEDLEGLNDKLLKACFAYGNHKIQGREKRVEELFEEEREALLRVPEHCFSNLQPTDNKVNGYSTVMIDKNHYSVPTAYAGLRTQVLLGIDGVEIFYGGKRIARHKRVFGNNKWQLDPQHYLEMIQQRPQAFHCARPISQWREKWPQSLELLLKKFQESQGETKGIKDFISVLMLYREHRAEDIKAAVELALENRISFSGGVKHLLLHTEPEPVFSPLENWPATPWADVSVYGQLGGVK